MSVINTMLKDLERRGADSANSGDKILGGLSSSNNRRMDEEPSSKVYWISLAGVMAIVAILAGGYYLSPYQLVSVARVESAPGPTEKTLPAAVAHEKNEAPLIAESAKELQQPVAATDPEKLPQQQAATEPVPVVAVVAPTKTAGVVARVNTQAPAVQETAVQKTAVVSSQTRPAVQRASAQADDADVEESTAESLLVVTKQQREFTPEEKSQQAYATAMTLYKQGRKQEAKSSLTEALSYSAMNADASRLLGVIYLEDGRADLAAEVIEQGLAVHANDQSLLRLYLQSLVQRENYKEAITVMEQRLKLTSPEDLGYLAGLHQKNNDHLNAVKMYAQALQLIPSKSVWWMGQAISLEIMQQYKEATQSYQKSLSTGQLSAKLAEYAISRMNIIKQHRADS
jgi:MSHA biogenesis protein MshN